MKKIIIPIISEKVGEAKATLAICRALSQKTGFVFNESIYVPQSSLDKLNIKNKIINENSPIFIGTGKDILYFYSESLYLKNNPFIWTSHRLPPKEKLSYIDDMTLMSFPEHLLNKKIFNFFDYSKSDIEFLKDKIAERKVLVTLGVPTYHEYNDLHLIENIFQPNDLKVIFLLLPSAKTCMKDLYKLIDTVCLAYCRYNKEKMQFCIIDTPRSSTEIKEAAEARMKLNNIPFRLFKFKKEKTESFIANLISSIPKKTTPFIISPYSSISQTIEFLKVFPMDYLYFYGMTHDEIPEKYFGKFLINDKMVTSLINPSIQSSSLWEFFERNKKVNYYRFSSAEYIIANEIASKLRV